jgi:hypothetical protein
MYQGFANGTNSAILRYAGAPKVEPIARDSPSKYPLVETALHPLVPTKVPGKHVAGGADVNLRLNISFNGTIGRYEINNAVGYLLQYYSMLYTDCWIYIVDVPPADGAGAAADSLGRTHGAGAAPEGGRLRAPTEQSD